MANHPIFGSFEQVASTTSGDHVYDFVGTATRVAFKRQWASHAHPSGRQVRPSEPPKNEHYLDWIAVLTAVDRAAGTFRMAELGAGWAPWLVRGALAARQRPAITGVELLAIEADPVHHGWILDHFRDNGLDPAAHHILHGAVSDAPGRLRFPVISDPDLDYGSSLRGAAGAPETVEVRGWTILEILARFSGPIDLMHVDMQGAEYDCLPDAMDALTAGVKSVMVGTHISDTLHDSLAAAFLAAGWRESINLPRGRTSVTPWGEVALGDGVLIFDNPALLP